MDPLQTAANYDQIAHLGRVKTSIRQMVSLSTSVPSASWIREGQLSTLAAAAVAESLTFCLRIVFKAEGLDISTEMLSLAKTKNPNVDFYQGDICQWRFPKQYDFISAWDSVWHVPLEQQSTVIRKLCDGLAPGGVLIVTTGGTDEPVEATNPFLGQPLYHCTIGISKLLRLVNESGVVCRHLEFDQGPEEKHVYLVVQKA